jgi:hypothetical protein
MNVVTVRRGPVILPRRRFRPGTLAIAATVMALPLGACHGLIGRQCSQGDSISDKELVGGAIDKIVRQSLANNRPNEVQYRSRIEFINANSSCCYVELPSSYAGKGFSLPMRQEVRVAIIYRRLKVGETPYSLRRVTVGPCPEDADESETLLNPDQYRASRNWKWNWRVRWQEARS